MLRLMNGLIRLCLLLALAWTEGRCSNEEWNFDSDVVSDVGNNQIYSMSQEGLGSVDFKVPLPQGYDWEITQSWAEHCQKCNAKGYDKISNGYYGDFCKLSHSSTDKNAGGCYFACKYGWDFNLPGGSDLGKSVLSSADGVVKKTDTKSTSSWGNYVVIDHGNNICSRYAHLLEGSITVVENQQVCQGLKIGAIGKSGNASGEHLHFQFENCNNLGVGIDYGFMDGNNKPQCIIGNDLYTNGVYTALKLTNVEKSGCGWSEGGCGKLKGCPLTSGCGNKGTPPFGDLSGMNSLTKASATYLWRECAISGKSDGKFHPEDTLTRAEALKIALQLFGLNSNCNVSESFSDVNPWDWFYPYVLCGIKYGIIESIYSGFLPNDTVTFAEAAKIIVESAKKAGKIEIKFPGSGHFSKIPITHWAYKYAETLFYYGGISSSTTKEAYDVMKRGDYAFMAASLSPCFCQSVKCSSGCACNQDTYSCDVTKVSTSGTPGGQTAGSSGSSSGGVDAWSASSGGSVQDAGESCTPYCYSKQCGADGCGGSCGQCASGYFCDTNGQCKCQPNCYSKQCGADGCGGSCGQCASGYFCDTNGQCKCQPNCYGKQCGQDGCGGSCGTCGTASYCDGGQCKAYMQSWMCEPSKGYSLKAASPGGTWEITHPSSYGPSYIKLPMPDVFLENSQSLHVNCDELPTSILIKGGPQWVKILVEDKTLPPLDVWLSFSGPLTPGPAFPPTLKAYELDLPAYSNLFVKIPSSFGVPACTPNCYNKQCGPNGCGGICGQCSNGYFCDANGYCNYVPPPAPPPTSTWICDPAKVYELLVYSPSGKWESLTSPASSYSQGVMPAMGTQLSFKFNCNELPSVLLVTGGPYGVQAWLNDKSLPAFGVFSPYNLPITINPSYKPDTVTQQFSTLQPNTKVLIRLPAK